MSELAYEKDNLPTGWAVCKLENVTTNVNSGFASGKHNKSGKGVPHIRPMNIDYFGNIDLSVVKYVKENFKDKLQENDVLFNNTNSPKLLGKTALIKENTNWAYSNHMTRIRANNSRIESSWLAIFLHKLFLDGFYKMIAKNHVNQSSINSMYLTTKIPIIIAPLNEQKRIISKIESIFAQIDAAKQQLERLASQVTSASGSLAQLKNSVLKQAFEGKLVSQDPNDEPAEVLLKRLRKNSEKELKFDKEGLPKGWVRTILRDVVDNVYKIDPKETPDKMYYYCDINSIDNSRLKITNPKQIFGELAPSRARQLIRTYDILFSTVRTYLRNIAIVPDDLNGQLASTGFCVIRSKIYNKFVFYYVQEKHFLDSLTHIQRGTSYPAVRNNDVLHNVIRLPPLPEQHRIIAKIESIFGNIDTLNLFYFILLGKFVYKS